MKKNWKCVLTGICVHTLAFLLLAIAGYEHQWIYGESNLEPSLLDFSLGLPLLLMDFPLFLLLDHIRATEFQGLLILGTAGSALWAVLSCFIGFICRSIASAARKWRTSTLER